MNHTQALPQPSRTETERDDWAERLACSIRSVEADIARLPHAPDAQVLAALQLVRHALERGAAALD